MSLSLLKSKRHFLGLLLIILLSTFLRLYALGNNPPSLDWDEASLGYNSYSLLSTARDEYGNFLPLSIRSFNDYKPPAYSYLSIPFIWIFGLNPFSVRLLSALAGTATVLVSYFLSRALWPEPRYRFLALITSLLFALSPWHLQFSRAAFESNLALFFHLTAITLALTWLKKHQTWLLVLSAVFAAGSLYSYHSARLVTPIFFLGFALIYHRHLTRHSRQSLLALALAFLLLLPLAKSLVTGDAQQRFQTVSVISNPGEFSRERELFERIRGFKADHTGPLSYLHTNKSAVAKIVSRNYFEHFNFDFLYLRADGNPRHHAVGFGLLYLALLPCLVFGAYQLASKNPKSNLLVFWILLVGPLASAFTADTPHSIRSLLMLPGLILLEAFGVYQLFSLIRQKLSLKLYKLSLIFFALLFGFNLVYYFNLYYVITPIVYSQGWQYGYSQLVDYITTHQSGYEEIIVTTRYDQPHIFFAFFQPIPPKLYQPLAQTAHQNINQIHFRDIKDSDYDLPNRLIAAAPNQTPDSAHIIHQIFFLDGQVAFNLVATSDKPDM